MGEWKAPLSLRIRQEFRRQLEEAAAKERRTLGNLGALLLEWAYEQFKVAGSTDRLLNARLTKFRKKRQGQQNPCRFIPQADRLPDWRT